MTAPETRRDISRPTDPAASSTEPPPREANVLRWIMWGVFGWGCLLAVGAGLHGIDPETGAITWAPRPVRGVIVFVSVVGLLAGWNWLLRQRARRG